MSSKTYKVGRSAEADIRLDRKHDAVGKLHLELTDLGKGEVRVRDLKSTNGTFVREHGRWVEIKAERVLAASAEIMLGDYETTPCALLDLIETRKPEPVEKPPQAEPEVKPARRLRRNEFGEIVKE